LPFSPPSRSVGLALSLLLALEPKARESLNYAQRVRGADYFSGAPGTGALGQESVQCDRDVLSASAASVTGRCAAMPTATTMLLMTPMALAAGEESVAASADEHGYELGNVAGDTVARALLPDDVAMGAEMHFDHWLGW
jgi:hypothetical protein